MSYVIRIDDDRPLPGDLQGRPLVLFVHGFRSSRRRVVKACWALRRLTEQISGRIAVLSFLWPSHRSHKSYGKARRDASEAAGFLARLLRRLKQHGCSVHLVAHSLGCRVALKALREAQVAYLALLGAAVSDDCLSVKGEFVESRLAAAQLDVFFSPKAFL